ncbi:hypothetical protein ACFQV2_20670 [Actinokineospora soli]|uniref:Uncharacterized protein n=1 Tax=Actinokineospora soli TaxID=1048753 RepID=A0ABW2TQT8_9PSEU
MDHQRTGVHRDQLARGQLPFHGVLRLGLVPVLDPAAIVEASVDVVYAEPGYERRYQATFPGGTQPARQQIDIPTLAAAPTRPTVTTTVVRADGSVFTGEPTVLAANQNRYVVTDGVGRTRQLEVSLADTDLAAAGLAAVRVRLRGPGTPPNCSSGPARPPRCPRPSSNPAPTRPGTATRSRATRPAASPCRARAARPPTRSWSSASPPRADTPAPLGPPERGRATRYAPR